MHNPWDQQEKESARAFERFALYRDMGAGRSLRKLAQDLELNLTTVADFSTKHKWKDRTAAFDLYIDRASQHNQLVQVKAMKRRQIALALRAQKVAERGLKKLLQNITDGEDKLRPEGLSKILDVACRLERLNRDEPEQNLEVKQQQNYDRLSLEECETLRQLHSKAQGST